MSLRHLHAHSQFVMQHQLGCDIGGYDRVWENGAKAFCQVKGVNRIHSTTCLVCDRSCGKHKAGYTWHWLLLICRPVTKVTIHMFMPVVCKMIWWIVVGEQSSKMTFVFLSAEFMRRCKEYQNFEATTTQRHVKCRCSPMATNCTCIHSFRGQRPRLGVSAVEQDRPEIKLTRCKETYALTKLKSSAAVALNCHDGHRDPAKIQQPRGYYRTLLVSSLKIHAGDILNSSENHRKKRESNARVFPETIKWIESV